MPDAKPPAESRVTLHQLMLPEHGNALGNVHGGVIMRVVDETGAICAMRHARSPCVTIAIDSMTFRQPVHLGDLLVCSATVTWVGRTSIEVGVTVHAENPVTGEISHTNSAFVVYVALGADGRPAAVSPLALVDDDARRHFDEGAERQRHRLSRKPSFPPRMSSRPPR
ncbi:MAG TPA: acyl-CoA thioesterase [Polyangiaceae bacterium]